MSLCRSIKNNSNSFQNSEKQKNSKKNSYYGNLLLVPIGITAKREVFLLYHVELGNRQQKATMQKVCIIVKAWHKNKTLRMSMVIKVTMCT